MCALRLRQQKKSIHANLLSRVHMGLSLYNCGKTIKFHVCIILRQKIPIWDDKAFLPGFLGFIFKPFLLLSHGIHLLETQLRGSLRLELICPPTLWSARLVGALCFIV